MRWGETTSIFWDYTATKNYFGFVSSSLTKNTLSLQRFRPAAVPSPLSVDASPVLLDVEVLEN
jgi:hypothetical protein